MPEKLPTYASVVVIGGGAMGCSTLYHLARAGIQDAVLLERHQLTSGTTWHSAAQVRALRSTQNLTDLIRYSIQLYQTLVTETGQDTGWIQKGSLSIATNPDRLVHIRRQMTLAQMFGLPVEAISAEAAKERWPLMNHQDVLGAVWSPDDGRVSPSDLCAALVKGAKSGGAKVFEQTPVTGVVTRAGRIAAVETEQSTIRCDAVALCAGLWSRQVAAMAGAVAPLWPCEHFYLLTKAIPGLTGNIPTLSDHDRHLYIRDDSGGLLVGCFEPMGKALDPAQLGENFAFQLLPEDWDQFEPMMVNALHRVPGLAEAEVKMLLNGPESFTPDGAFLLGETAETKGLYLGCGMNSVGVASAGGAGMALAQMIQTGRPPMDLQGLDPKRFADCVNHADALAARAPEVLGKHYEISYPGRQWQTARSLRRLPLHRCWQQEKAHFGESYGFERPLYFAKTDEPILRFTKPDWFDQVGREVTAAHNHVALFDQSSLGKIMVEGPDAARFLNRVCSNQMDRPVGRAMYTLLLNETGTIEADLVAVRLAEEQYRLYVGTAAPKRDITWLTRHLNSDDTVGIHDCTDDFAVLALAGPGAAAMAQKIGADDLNALSFYGAGGVTIAGVDVEAVRMSFVGEAGWELTCAAADAERLYQSFKNAGVTPAGLFAQSSMRIEKKFLANGHDFDTETTPFEVGLQFALHWDKDFVGRDALCKQRTLPPENHLVTLKFLNDAAVPLGNEPVYAGDRIIGRTTSAAYGYRIGAPIALAFVPVEYTDGTNISVDIAGMLHSAHVSKGPAFDPTGSRMRVK